MNKVFKSMGEIIDTLTEEQQIVLHKIVGAIMSYENYSVDDLDVFNDEQRKTVERIINEAYYAAACRKDYDEGMIDRLLEARDRTAGFDHVVEMYGVDAAMEWLKRK